MPTDRVIFDVDGVPGLAIVLPDDLGPRIGKPRDNILGIAA
jgi:hypothetical protein